MTKREAIHKELADLYTYGVKLAVSFQKNKDEQFQYDYQIWYTKALNLKFHPIRDGFRLCNQ